MKKKIAAIVLVTGIALASVASANWGNNMRGNAGNCPQMQGMAAQAAPDPAVQAKLDKFFADTVDLRKQLAMKRAEKMAMMRSDNPDPAASAKLAGEMFDLRAAMEKKADVAGVDQYLGGPGGGMGCGCDQGMAGRGQGRHGGGMGGGRF